MKQMLPGSTDATVSIPRSPRTPSDMATLEAVQPMAHTFLHFGLVERMARAERTAYLQSLIDSALSQG